jgi:hypothetical protein
MPGLNTARRIDEIFCRVPEKKKIFSGEENPLAKTSLLRQDSGQINPPE